MMAAAAGVWRRGGSSSGGGGVCVADRRCCRAVRLRLRAAARKEGSRSGGSGSGGDAAANNDPFSAFGDLAAGPSAPGAWEDDDGDNVEGSGPRAPGDWGRGSRASTTSSGGRRGGRGGGGARGGRALPRAPSPAGGARQAGDQVQPAGSRGGGAKPRSGKATSVRNEGGSSDDEGVATAKRSSGGSDDTADEEGRADRSGGGGGGGDSGWDAATDDDVREVFGEWLGGGEGGGSSADGGSVASTAGGEAKEEAEQELASGDFGRSGDLPAAAGEFDVLFDPSGAAAALGLEDDDGGGSSDDDGDDDDGGNDSGGSRSRSRRPRGSSSSASASGAGAQEGAGRRLNAQLRSATSLDELGALLSRCLPRMTPRQCTQAALSWARLYRQLPAEGGGGGGGLRADLALLSGNASADAATTPPSPRERWRTSTALQQLLARVVAVAGQLPPDKAALALRAVVQTEAPGAPAAVAALLRRAHRAAPVADLSPDAAAGALWALGALAARIAGGGAAASTSASAAAAAPGAAAPELPADLKAEARAFVLALSAAHAPAPYAVLPERSSDALAAAAAAAAAESEPLDGWRAQHVALALSGLARLRFGAPLPLLAAVERRTVDGNLLERAPLRDLSMAAWALGAMRCRAAEARGLCDAVAREAEARLAAVAADARAAMAEAALSFDREAYVARGDRRMDAFRARWGQPPARRRRGTGAAGAGADETAAAAAAPPPPPFTGFGASPTSRPARMRKQQQQEQEQGQQQEQPARRPPRWPGAGDPAPWLAAAREAVARELARGTAPDGLSWAGLVRDELAELPPAEDPLPPPAWLLECTADGGAHGMNAREAALIVWALGECGALTPSLLAAAVGAYGDVWPDVLGYHELARLAAALGGAGFYPYDLVERIIEVFDCDEAAARAAPDTLALLLSALALLDRAPEEHWMWRVTARLCNGIGALTPPEAARACAALASLGETNSPLITAAAAGARDWLPACPAGGLADFARALAAYGLDAYGAHQTVADAAAARLRAAARAGGPLLLSRGGGGGVGGDDGFGGQARKEFFFDAATLERLLAAMLARPRGDADLGPLLSAIEELLSLEERGGAAPSPPPALAAAMLHALPFSAAAAPGGATSPLSAGALAACLAALQPPEVARALAPAARLALLRSLADGGARPAGKDRVWLAELAAAGGCAPVEALWLLSKLNGWRRGGRDGGGGGGEGAERTAAAAAATAAARKDDAESAAVRALFAAAEREVVALAAQDGGGGGDGGPATVPRLLWLCQVTGHSMGAGALDAACAAAQAAVPEMGGESLAALLRALAALRPAGSPAAAALAALAARELASAARKRRGVARWEWARAAADYVRACGSAGDADALLRAAEKEQQAAEAEAAAAAVGRVE